MSYPPGYQPAPQYQQPQQPQPGYYQPANPTVAPHQYQQPQQYAPQGQWPQAGYAPQAPAPQLARGTIEEWLDQRTGGGGPATSKYFSVLPQGSWLHWEVIRDLANTDVRQQTDINGIPQTYRDRTPKLELLIPIRILAASHPAQAQQVFPEGTATLYVKGLLKDELTRAMAAVGDSSGIPKGGAQGVQVFDGKKQVGKGVANLFTLNYTAPANGSAPQAAPEVAAAPVPPTPQAQAPAAVTPPPIPAPAPVQYAAPVAQAPQFQPAPAAPPTGAVTPTAPVPPAPVTQGGETKDRLLARLQGG